MKPLTAKEVEEYLKDYGFILGRVRGSHFGWYNPENGRTAVVPHHGNRAIPQGTLISIFNGAGIPKPQR